MRRRARYNASLTELAKELELRTGDLEEWNDEHFDDDRLRLIFICCHPAFSPEARVVMTMREVCGLTTQEIARAFLKVNPVQIIDSVRFPEFPLYHCQCVTHLSSDFSFSCL